MQSQILITGATGFIGRHLTRHLVMKGHSVRILAREPKKARVLFGHAVEIIQGDVRDQLAVTRAATGMETIYHVAGVFRFGQRHCRELWETNVEGTENILRAAAAAGTKKIVHLSSASILNSPANRPDRLLNETDFPRTAPRFSPYKKSKWLAECRVLEWARRGLPVSIASVSCPIGGDDDTPTPTGQIVRDFLGGKFPGYCHTGLNFVDVRDFGAGLRCVAERGRPGERYLLGERNLYLKEFLELLSIETGIPVPTWRVPHALIWLAGVGGECFDFFCRRGPTARVCLETASQSRYFQFFDSRKAQEQLNWAPVYSVTDGIREAVRWFRRPTHEQAQGAHSWREEVHVP